MRFVAILSIFLRLPINTTRRLKHWPSVSADYVPGTQQVNSLAGCTVLRAGDAP